MKLKDFARLIGDMAEAHPDVDVVYSHDDEGNEFHKVHYEPALGQFTGNAYGRGEFDNEGEINAICIN